MSGDPTPPETPEGVYTEEDLKERRRVREARLKRPKERTAEDWTTLSYSTLGFAAGCSSCGCK